MKRVGASGVQQCVNMSSRESQKTVRVLTYVDQDFSISCINVCEDKKLCTNVYIQLLNRKHETIDKQLQIQLIRKSQSLHQDPSSIIMDPVLPIQDEFPIIEFGIGQFIASLPHCIFFPPICYSHAVIPS
jgi:hypothetical protein